MCYCACANNTRSGKKDNMASMNAWPSVLVKRAGKTIISRKIVKCEWSETLGEIIERVDRTLSQEVVEKVMVSSNAQFLDPVYEIPLDGLIELLKDYGMNVLFYLSGDADLRRSESSGRNVYEILMASSRKRVLPSKMTSFEQISDQHKGACNNCLW